MQSKTVSLSGSPAPARGPTPASAETSYHKRLRSLLVEHRRLRAEWNQLVMRGLVGRVRASIELWVEIELTLASLRKAVARTGSTAAWATAGGRAASERGRSKESLIRAGYLVEQGRKVAEQMAVIQDVVASLEKCLDGMRAVGANAEALTVEAARVRGIEFAFKTPLWVTWPLARFGQSISRGERFPW